MKAKAKRMKERTKGATMTMERMMRTNTRTTPRQERVLMMTPKT